MHDPPGTEIPSGWGGLIGRTIRWGGMWIFSGTTHYNKHVPHVMEHVIPYGVQGWRSGESTRLPPMWPRFDSQIQCQMWVEFLRGFLWVLRFPLSSKTKICLDCVKF